jgi:hypothetical protein
VGEDEAAAHPSERLVLADDAGAEVGLEPGHAGAAGAGKGVGHELQGEAHPLGHDLGHDALGYASLGRRTPACRRLVRRDSSRDRDPRPGGRRLHDLGGLLGQPAVVVEPEREVDGDGQRVVVDPHCVALLQAGDAPPEDLQRLVPRRLLDVDLLEAALEGGIGVQVPPVHLRGRNEEEAQVDPSEGLLERLRGESAPEHRLPGAEERVQVFDYEEDLGVRARLLERGLEHVRERSAVLPVGAERIGDELHEAPAGERRVLASGGLRGEGVDDRGAADAALPDEDGVVLRRARQDLLHLLQLRAAAHEGRVVPGREGREVAPVAVEVGCARRPRRLVAGGTARRASRGPGGRPGDAERVLLQQVQARAEVP